MPTYPAFFVAITQEIGHARMSVDSNAKSNRSAVSYLSFEHLKIVAHAFW